MFFFFFGGGGGGVTCALPKNSGGGGHMGPPLKILIRSLRRVAATCASLASPRLYVQHENSEQKQHAILCSKHAIPQCVHKHSPYSMIECRPVTPAKLSIPRLLVRTNVGRTRRKTEDQPCGASA